MTIVVDDKGVRIADEEDEDDFETDDEQEIEEGEIIEDTDDDEDLEEMDFDHPVHELGDMLASVLTTPDGDTLCSTLVNIGNQIENQNRILIKIFSTLKNMTEN
jgi:hypothetical protein